MVLIIKSKKDKISQIAETLHRHRLGTLPKSFYSPKGKLFSKGILSKNSQARCQKISDTKDYEARERAIEKIKCSPIKKDKVYLTKENIENYSNDGRGNGRSRQIFKARP